MCDSKKRLEDLLEKHGERGKPFAFAGRDEIISKVLRSAKGQGEEIGPGKTYVITGAPGAGKTALLYELMKRCGESIACIVCEKVPNEQQTRKVWRQVASHLSGIPEDDFFISTHETLCIEGGVNAIVKTGGSYTTGESRPSIEISSCAAIKDLVGETGEGPVIVCIDEIQNIQPNTPAAELVEDLHTQSKIPVLLVCSGLSNSLQALRRIGISRTTLRTSVPLGQLERGEVLRSAKEGLGKIAQAAGIDPNGLAERLAEPIAAETDRWPKHLTSYLHGTIDALIGQDVPSLETLGVEQVLEYGRKIRQVYYHERVDASELPITVIQKIYEAIHLKGYSLDEEDCINLIAREHDRTNSVAFRESYSTATEAFHQALRSGVITLSNMGGCEIPIPTLETFVDQEVQRKRGRDNIDAKSARMDEGLYR